MTGENQVTNIVVGLAYPDHANMAALKSGNNGDIAVLKSDGSAPTAGAEFMIPKKNYKGTITTGDIVNPAKLRYGKVELFKARVGKEITISGIEVVENKLYTVAIIVSGYGSLSVENEYIKEGYYKSKTGDTAENIVDGLVKSLARNFSRESRSTGETFSYTDAGANNLTLKDNAYFEFAKTGTGANAALVISEKEDYLAQYYVTGKKTRLELPFRIQARFPGEATNTVTEAGTQGIGTGYQVRNLEYYLQGNYQDTFRYMGYPNNFEPHYDSVLTGEYHTVTLGYYDEGRDDPMKSKKDLIITVDSAIGDAAMNALITDLNTAINGANGIVLDTIVIP